MFITTNQKYIFNRLLFIFDINHIDKCLKDEIKSTTEYLMIQLDPDLTGFVTEPQFIENVKLNYSEYELDQILSFDLIPSELLDSAHMQQSLPGSNINVDSNSNLKQVCVLFICYIK